MVLGTVAIIQLYPRNISAGRNHDRDPGCPKPHRAGILEDQTVVKTNTYIHTRTQAQVHYPCGGRESEMSGTEPRSVQEIFGQRIKKIDWKLLEGPPHYKEVVPPQNENLLKIYSR